MTSEEQRIAIAEHCGWRVYENPVTQSMGRTLPTACIVQCPNGWEKVALPDYAESVSARKAAWEKLTEKQRQQMRDELFIMAAGSLNSMWIETVQFDHWPEAYLRAVGKWKD